jgi:hypothetical protein
MLQWLGPTLANHAQPVLCSVKRIQLPSYAKMLCCGSGEAQRHADLWRGFSVLVRPRCPLFVAAILGVTCWRNEVAFAPPLEIACLAGPSRAMPRLAPPCPAGPCLPRLPRHSIPGHDWTGLSKPCHDLSCVFLCVLFERSNHSLNNHRASATVLDGPTITIQPSLKRRRCLFTKISHVIGVGWVRHNVAAATWPA